MLQVMKTYIVIFSLCLLSLSSAGQSDPCDTPDRGNTYLNSLPWRGNTAYLAQLKHDFEQTDPGLRTYSIGLDGATYNVPVKVYVYRDDAADNEVYTSEEAEDLLNRMNRNLATTQIPMRLYTASIQQIVDPSRKSPSQSETEAILQDPANSGTYMDIHLIFAGANRAVFPDDPNGIPYTFVLSTLGVNEEDEYEERANIGTHELGHTFGLLHTHQGSQNPSTPNGLTDQAFQEPVSRLRLKQGIPRCALYGDVLCTTAGDPLMSRLVNPGLRIHSGCISTSVH